MKGIDPDPAACRVPVLQRHGLAAAVAILMALAAWPALVRAVEDIEPGWISRDTTVAMHLPGLSYHFEDPEAEGRHWNQRHADIGVEWRTVDQESMVVRKKAVGLLRDSLARWGGYASYTWQHRLRQTDDWALDAGAGAFLFYRALEFDGPREWVPGILPVASVEYRPWKLGLNVVVVPPFQVNGQRMVGVVYGQLTKVF